MRRVGVVTFMALPWLAWLLVRLYVGTHLDGWLKAPEALSLTVRLALAADNWATRMNPFLVICTVFLSPLITPVIIWSAGHPGNDAAKRTARWLLTSAACLAFPTVVISVALTSRPSAQVGMTLMVLTVAACAAAYGSYAVSLGAALAWQRERVSRGYSTLSPRRALRIALALQYLGVLAMLVPLTIWYRGRSDLARAGSAA